MVVVLIQRSISKAVAMCSHAFFPMDVPAEFKSSSRSSHFSFWSVMQRGATPSSNFVVIKPSAVRCLHFPLCNASRRYSQPSFPFCLLKILSVVTWHSSFCSAAAMSLSSFSKAVFLLLERAFAPLRLMSNVLISGFDNAFIASSNFLTSNVSTTSIV